jgi:hypothetical protein
MAACTRHNGSKWSRLMEKQIKGCPTFGRYGERWN